MHDRQSKNEKDNDAAFTGYLLRGVEETVKRLESQQASTDRMLARIERKVEALASGATPDELKTIIAAINAETAKVTEATATVAGVTDQLDKTGV